MLSWNAFDGVLMTTGSRNSAINTAWRLVPEDQRTPARRKLIIALVDHVREYHATTGRLSPEPDTDAFDVVAAVAAGAS